MPRDKNEIKILHFSDTHITARAGFIQKAFLRATEQINQLDVDYIIHTGDVTEEGTEEDYQLAKKLLSEIEREVIYVIGNHDARNVGYELFEEYLGPTSQLFVDDRVLIAGFDSTIPDRDGGRFGGASIQRLKDVLRENGEDKTKIVAFHHHLLPIPKAGRERSMILDAGDVLKVVLDYDIDLVLNGHRHTPNIFRTENSMVINSGTASHYKTRAGESHSFNLITLSHDGMIEVKVFNVETSTWRRTVKMMERGDNLLPAVGSRIARIVHISDTHFGDSLEFLPETYSFAVKRINRLHPDLVIHCGDVTDDGLPNSFEIAIRELQKMTDPKLLVPGPHDLLHLGHLLFRERMGTFNPVFKGRNYSVYGINSAQYDEMDGWIGRTHLQNLVKKLSKIEEVAIKIVVFHHHILPLPHAREKYPIEDAGDVLRQLLDIKVDMILTGHRHVSHSQKIDDTVVVNANTLSSRRFQARYGNTFNLIDILSNGTVIVSEIAVITGMRRILGIYRLSSMSSAGSSKGNS